MNEKALQLYDQLQADISGCREKGLTPAKEIECCFHIAEKYWAHLRNEITSYEFKEEDEEIKFFKEIKPKFTSESEFYGLRYHAQLFVDETSSHDHALFWKRELKRLTKFQLENQEFYDYYRSGCRDYDSIWFVRDTDKLGTVYDQLLASLLALERYTSYIQNEVYA